MARANTKGLRADMGLKYEQPVRPIFARHETFHPRHGWLKKGLQKLEQVPDIFFRDDGPTLLGVGKNMAKSIRYWMWAFKLTSDDWKGNKSVQPSLDWLGAKLMASEGFDPFLEDTASLWLLHWNLLKAPCYATTWDFAFNSFREKEFTPDSMLLALKSFITGKEPDLVVSENSLKSDISCLIRMYAKNTEAESFLEESLDCPFALLGLLASVPKTKEFSFVYGPKPSLPDEIVTVACLEFASRIAEGQSSINLARLLFESGSPGLVFKIGESDICNAIEACSSQRSGLKLVESGGRLQMFWDGAPDAIAASILESFFAGR